MGRPQQPELNRSGRTPLQPDSLESELEGRRQRRPGQGDEARGPLPEDNRPGHHPSREQDKPDPDAFVERFGNGGRGNGEGVEAETDGSDRGPEMGSDDSAGGLLVEHLVRELGDRIRRRDPVLIATYPIHATVELLRYGRDRVLALNE